MERIVLGLSGGVDSTVAAKRLLELGYAVEGVWLDLGFGSPAAAERAAAELGIGFSVFDAADAHERLVRAPFGEAYRRGLTPNPCAVCNPRVKLPSLLAAADKLGAEKIATGHYAAVRRGETGRMELLASGGRKDQSYMLALVPQEQLERLVLPLTGLEKPEVKSAAAASALSAAGEKESQDICFIPDGDYGAWLERRGLGRPEGDFVDASGRVLGRHRGIHRYTVGQRRGLGVSWESRLYVGELRPEREQVLLCPAEDLLVTEVRAEAVNWVSVSPRQEPFPAEVKLRHSRQRTGALVLPEADGSLSLRFSEPVRRPAPGQLAAGYMGDLLLFGGSVCRNKEEA
jgi:tRNA-specific 2-thiouridylase